MDNNKPLCSDLEPYSATDYYNDIAEFILAKIVKSPSPEVAFYMADFLHHLANEILVKRL